MIMAAALVHIFDDAPDVRKALARLLADVAVDPDLRARLGAGGRASVTRFTWDRVTDAYEDAFRTSRIEELR